MNHSLNDSVVRAFQYATEALNRSFRNIRGHTLTSEINLHKFVDDSTLSEVLPRFGSRMMLHKIDELNKWSKAIII